MAPSRHAFIARLLGLALVSAAVARAALWVSPAGDDANPGTEEQPLATIERARDIVRTLNRDMSDDITVFIGGTHRIGRPIEFGPEDSATNGFSIVYTAAPGEHPVLSGGLRVEGWTLSDRSRNLWWAPAPAGLADSHDLFVNSVPASWTRGRLVQAFVRRPSGSTVATPDSKVLWKNPSDIVFPPLEPGAIWSERLGTPPFFVDNAFELLGTPGEWYFDRPERRIYYTPRAGEDLMAIDVEAALAEALIGATGTHDSPVKGLIFKGIRFEHTTAIHSSDAGSTGPRALPSPAAAVRFAFARDIQLLEDEFVHLGTPALDLGPGVDGAAIEGCVFGDISRTALRIAGSSRVRVADSRFSYVAAGHADGAAVDVRRSEAVVIEHDQIDHFPRFAIIPQGGKPGEVRIAMNLISPPAIDFEGRLPDGDPRESAASDAGVSAAYRAVLAERFGGSTPPGPPSHVSAESADKLVYLTWDPPCQDGGSPVASYTIASSGGARITVTAEEFRAKGFAVFGDLENNHAVNFTVAASNATGKGPPSIPTANVVPARKRKQKPPQPPTASVERHGGDVRIEITPPAADGGSPVLSYSFATIPSGRRVVIEGWDVIHASAADPVAREIDGYPLDPGSTIAVSATNAAGEGGPAILRLQQ